ncbi:hypothetical protein JCM19992_02160 [Thermostilla marina]
MNRSRLLLFLWILAVLCPSRTVFADRPNILLILADDMGYSDLGCMGGDARTPNLDSLAAHGVLFVNFYNNAKCAPTRAALMTGLWNQRTRAYHAAGDVTLCGMTPAEALADEYVCLMIDKWHIRPKPLELGFERYFGSPLTPIYWWPESDTANSTIWIDDRPYTEADMTVPVDDWYLTVEDTNFAIRFLKEEVVTQGKRKPFFMYYATHAPHWPLQAPRADVDRYLKTFENGTDAARRRRYEQMIRLGIVDQRHCKLSPLDDKTPAWDALREDEKQYYRTALAVHTAMVDRLDQELGRLFDYLKANDLFDNTAIFFLSDNGASAEGHPTIIPPGRRLGDRGTHGRLNAVGASVCNTPMRGFKSTLYEGGIATPMIFHWPAGIGRPGIVSRQVGHVVDIFPTILEIAELDYPAEYAGRNLHPLDGRSLLPHLRSGHETERTLCWNYERYAAVRQGPWKALLRRGRGNRPDGSWELYNLAEDRSETENLAASHPAVLESLRRIWEAWRQDVGPLE